MNKIFMPEVSPEERLRLLEGNADLVEETKYIKQLTPEEVDIKRETHTDNSIKLNDLDTELKDIKANYKRAMDPIKDANAQLLQEIKTKQELAYGRLYSIADVEGGFMETFDEKGEMVGSHRLRPDEKQGKLFPLKKAQ